MTNFEEDLFYASRYTFWHHHSLAAIGGLAIPDIVIRRVLNYVEVSWTTDAGSTRPDIRWIESQGCERLPIQAVYDVIRETCIETAKQLDGRADNTREICQLIQTTRWEIPKQEPFSLAASGSTSHFTEMDKHTIEVIVENARVKSQHLVWVPTPKPAPVRSPWAAGYELANEYRQHMQWSPHEAVPNLERHLSGLGIDVSEVALSPTTLHGLSIVGPKYRPTVRWNQSSPRSDPSWSRQFTLAHELCHLLHDWVPSEDFAILSDESGSDWSTEARANAFAAELIMPREGLTQIIAGRALDTDLLNTIMKHFNVGKKALTQHLKNLDYISEDTRFALVSA